MKNLSKIFISILFVLFLGSIPLSAKDSAGIGIQFGALGSEKSFYSSSTVSGDSISIPYTKTTFNPDIHIVLSIPVCDIDENSFLGIDFGYDFSWDYTNISFTSYKKESSTFSRRFSLIPEFTYVKSNFRFFTGSGFSFGIEPYKYESTLSESNYTNYKFFWMFCAGGKYKLGKHLFAVADITFFANIFDTYTDDDYESTTSGSSVMEFLPKFGLNYYF